MEKNDIAESPFKTGPVRNEMRKGSEHKDELEGMRASERAGDITAHTYNIINNVIMFSEYSNSIRLTRIGHVSSRSQQWARKS